ncbi:hypothetical protein HDU82_003338 [Entophlyctis luteolus]|nr:hypothetical protein HDU82_003338 [Entophlyctis luteolus]
MVGLGIVGLIEAADVPANTADGSTTPVVANAELDAIILVVAADKALDIVRVKPVAVTAAVKTSVAVLDAVSMFGLVPEVVKVVVVVDVVVDVVVEVVDVVVGASVVVVDVVVEVVEVVVDEVDVVVDVVVEVVDVVVEVLVVVFIVDAVAEEIDVTVGAVEVVALDKVVVDVAVVTREQDAVDE